MNHAFVTTKSNIDLERVDRLLTELLRAKWGAAIDIERVGDIQWDIAIRNAYGMPVMGLCVWRESPRKLEMRKHLGDLSSWLQAYIQEHLADALHGVCRQEFVTGSTKPAPETVETFERWWVRERGEDPEEDSLLVRALERIPPPCLGL